MEQEKKKSVWGVIIKVIIAVATALAGTLGLTACGVW
ncbi:smalltalk protein [Parabacteroides distasonis]|uniref:Smalltalk protein n=1 Tax=Parabacteroides distasonis TaxID=823 RepID=A0A6I2N4N0_PARDI|nr:MULTISPECIES: smalltalk protein [Parabacteroides]MSL92601.1 smalltalk protein [Escherichia coli]MBS4835752.1 smalltalk protein [Parabacteroides sp.]MBT1281559.1 smalltalk protein [Parabacteroides distasonis]MBV4226378.1 smalltalk protein [Parabacteroides distasonis]MCC2767051.1 smalltalk protein [Parabacteroides distasonis]